MNVYNLSQDEVFDIDKGNSTKNIDFGLDSNNEFAIYDSNNYNNVRPIFKEFMEDYSIEPNKNDFNREIELQKIREQNEIMKNYGEISISSDPRITKYGDTYSVLPYSDFKVMNTTEADSDIVKSLDHCKGEWVDVDRCNPNKPCKRILQEYIIQNPNYTGDHCRVDRERVRDGDTRMVYCDQYNNCNGHGRCEGYDICTCDEGYSGNNCDNTCPNTNCNNGVAIPPDCNCSCNPGYSGNNCDICNKDCGIHGQIDNCNCICKDGYTGDTCNIQPNKCEHPVKIDCHNGTCQGGICSCEDGYTGLNCETKLLCNDVNASYCGENGKVMGNIPDGCSCLCNTGYSGDRCENINKCDIPCINGKISGYAGNCECLCDPRYTGSSCDTYDCSILKDELIYFETNYPNMLLYFTNGDTINSLKINDIINIDQITGLLFNLSNNVSLDITLWLNAYTYIFENKILEKIFECRKNFNHIELLCYNYAKEFDDITISIFNILKKYNLLNYVNYITVTSKLIVNTINLLVTISEKYYKNMPLRVLTDSPTGYFTSGIATPLVYFVNGIDETNIKSPCILKNKLKENVDRPGINVDQYNKYIPLEYFRDCIPAN